MRLKKISFSKLKRSNPKIILGQDGRANIQNTDFDGVDFENNGQAYINRSSMRRNALTNTETGTMDVGDLSLNNADLLNKGHIKAAQLSLNQRQQDERMNVGLMQRLVDRVKNHWFFSLIGVISSILGIIALF